MSGNRWVGTYEDVAGREHERYAPVLFRTALRSHPRRSLAVISSLTAAVLALAPSHPATAATRQAAPSAHGSRLRGVDWQQAAGKDLDCRVPGLGLEAPVVRYYDITGDGVPESFVKLRCRTGDSSAFDQLEVFDGASNPADPRRLDILVRAPRSHEYAEAIRTGMKIKSVSFSGSTVTTTWRMFRAQDSSACPSLVAKRIAAWNGQAFDFGPLKTSRLDSCS